MSSYSTLYSADRIKTALLENDNIKKGIEVKGIGWRGANSPYRALANVLENGQGSRNELPRWLYTVIHQNRVAVDIFQQTR